jgi:protein O-mannosyl-transferase
MKTLKRLGKNGAALKIVAVICSNSGRRMALVCALLALATLALYWPVHRYDFIDFDDHDYVFDNPTVRDGLTWWGLVWSFVDAHAFNWHPLTWLSHMLDCQLFGLYAGGHHLVNAILHCANGVLLFLVMRRLSGTFWRSAFVAAVFALHPMRVESVAWISERKDVLSGLFFMLTLWAYTRHVQTRQNGAAPQSLTEAFRSRWYVFALVLFGLGLLSKPMLVTVPFILLLVDYWPLNRVRPSSRSGGSIATEAREQSNSVAGESPRNLLREKVPFVALAAVLSVITFLAQRSGGATKPGESISLFSRVANMLIGYVSYLKKLLWPENLSFLYLRPESWPTGELVIAVGVLLLISMLATLNIRRRPYLAMGWLWYLAMLVPVSGLIPVGLQSIADRYTYLPAIGLSIMVAWGANDLSETWFPMRIRRWLVVGCAAAVLVACMMAARHQLRYWANTETLMKRALEVDPNNYVAHICLGTYYSRHGPREKASEHRLLARELNPATRQIKFGSGTSSAPK